MAERKVLVKYYPPDYDPKQLIRLEKRNRKTGSQERPKLDRVRMMLPMSVRCNTCGHFLYIGTKFNMRKEVVQDMDYLGIKVIRFYFKCTCCHAEITMRTDPKEHDYLCETGATRNYEARKDMAHAEAKIRALDESQEDAMKKLENRTFDSRREMEILDSLEEVKQLNKRRFKLNPDRLLLETKEKKEDVEVTPKDILRLVEQYKNAEPNSDDDTPKEEAHLQDKAIEEESESDSNDEDEESTVGSKRPASQDLEENHQPVMKRQAGRLTNWKLFGGGNKMLFSSLKTDAKK